MRKRIIALVWVIAFTEPTQARAQSTAIETFTTVSTPANSISSENWAYPVGWSFTANVSFTTSALGLWLPDFVTTQPHFTQGLNAQYAVGLARVTPPTNADPQSSFANYPSARTIVTGPTSVRGRDFGGGAFWYAPIPTFAVNAGDAFAVWIALTSHQGGVYPYGVFQTLITSAITLDSRLEFTGGWQADGTFLNGDPLYIGDGPSAFDGPNSIQPRIGGDFIIDAPVTSVPEPSTFWLLVLGFAGVTGLRWQRTVRRR